VFFTFQDNKNRNRQNLRFRIPTRYHGEGAISRRITFTITFHALRKMLYTAEVQLLESGRRRIGACR
jgi:hypothetical protein